MSAHEQTRTTAQAGSDANGTLAAYVAQAKRGDILRENAISTAPAKGIVLSDIVATPDEYTNDRTDWISLGYVVKPSVITYTELSGRKRCREFSTGDLYIIPKDACEKIVIHTTMHDRSLSVKWDHLDELLGGEDEASLDFEPLADEVFRSPLMSSIFARFDFSGFQNDPLFTETLARTLFLDLRLMQQRMAKRELSRPHLLSRRDIMRLDAYLDAHRGAKPSLRDLAGVVDLRTSIFAKSFKATTGMSPYQYAIARRLDRAQDLLVHSQMSIAQIAHQCGFSSQSHLTDVFRDRRGITPGQIRKSVQ